MCLFQILGPGESLNDHRMSTQITDVQVIPYAHNVYYVKLPIIRPEQPETIVALPLCTTNSPS